MKEFDDNEAIEFIRIQVPECKDVSDDDLQLVIDIMFDYDESLGYEYDGDAGEVAPCAAYVRKELKKDGENGVDLDLVEKIVEAEFAYESTLDE